MNAVLTLSDEICSSIQSLEAECNNISPGLLFCDAFVAKKTINNTNDEMEFWYAIANLYGLFFDCAPYVFRNHNQFHRQKYTDSKPKTLLDILVENDCLTDEERRTIKNYIFAIEELRHCFCHNKPLSTFNYSCIKRVFGDFPVKWLVFPYLDKYGRNVFDYSEGLKLLSQKTRTIFQLLSTAISKLSQIITDDIIDDWSRAIVSWYFQSDDVIKRSLASYYDSHPTHSSKLYQVEQWKKDLFKNVKSRSDSVGKKWEDFLLDIIEDLTYNASDSHIRSTAETIMPDFFDEVLF